MMVAPLDERTNRRRSCVEDRDFVLVDQLPEATFIRMVRRTLVHENGRPGRQWPIDDIAMPCHPTDICRAPEDVLITMIKHPLKRLFHKQVVAGSRVLDPLWLPGRAAGVQDEQ